MKCWVRRFCSARSVNGRKWQERALEVAVGGGVHRSKHRVTGVLWRGGGVHSKEQVDVRAAGSVQKHASRESLNWWRGCSVSHSESPLVVATNPVAAISGDSACDPVDWACWAWELGLWVEWVVGFVVSWVLVGLGLGLGFMWGLSFGIRFKRV